MFVSWLLTRKWKYFFFIFRNSYFNHRTHTSAHRERKTKSGEFPVVSRLNWDQLCMCLVVIICPSVFLAVADRGGGGLWGLTPSFEFHKIKEWQKKRGRIEKHKKVDFCVYTHSWINMQFSKNFTSTPPPFYASHPPLKFFWNLHLYCLHISKAYGILLFPLATFPSMGNCCNKYLLDFTCYTSFSIGCR